MKRHEAKGSKMRRPCTPFCNVPGLLRQRVPTVFARARGPQDVCSLLRYLVVLIKFKWKCPNSLYQLRFEKPVLKKFRLLCIGPFISFGDHIKQPNFILVFESNSKLYLVLLILCNLSDCFRDIFVRPRRSPGWVLTANPEASLTFKSVGATWGIYLYSRAARARKWSHLGCDESSQVELAISAFSFEMLHWSDFYEGVDRRRHKFHLSPRPAERLECSSPYNKTVLRSFSASPSLQYVLGTGSVLVWGCARWWMRCFRGPQVSPCRASWCSELLSCQILFSLAC